MAGATARDLERLYRERYAHFVRVASALVRDEEQGVDVVQEAFATAIRRRRSYRGEGPLEAWVWRIVVNAAKKARSRPAKQLVDDALEHERDPSPSPVRAAIVTLPERQRLVLFLRYYADLDYRSIAEALEISTGTVAATLNAAHTSLRNLLEEARR